MDGTELDIGLLPFYELLKYKQGANCNVIP